MGYTHYWSKEGEINPADYKAALKDCVKIIKSKLDILAGPEATGKPKVSMGISFNGKDDEGHETFSLPPSPDQLKKFEFCKTARKPYDVVVTACLARMAEVKGFGVSSDGNASEWSDGLALASSVLGRKIPNPIKEETEEAEAKITKAELKKELQSLGIKVEGNYVRKKDLEKIVKAEYQGWTNYETWNVNLWISGDESMYKAAKREQPFTEDSAEEFVLEMLPIGTPDFSNRGWAKGLYKS